MKPQQITKYQHTIPKCYLKNFSDDGISICRKFKAPHTGHDSERNKEFNKPLALKNATVVEDFYTVKSGNNPMVVEEIVYANLIENDYPDIYKLLIDADNKDFDMKQRTKILSFFLSLHSRTPKQFELFFETIPESYQYELDKIKEDYKGAHIKDVLPALLGAHEFKVVRIARITDSSEFITSDNPVLIIGPDGNLKNHNYKQQFSSVYSETHN